MTLDPPPHQVPLVLRVDTVTEELQIFFQVDVSVLPLISVTDVHPNLYKLLRIYFTKGLFRISCWGGGTFLESAREK